MVLSSNVHLPRQVQALELDTFHGCIHAPMKCHIYPELSRHTPHARVLWVSLLGTAGHITFSGVSWSSSGTSVVSTDSVDSFHTLTAKMRGIRESMDEGMLVHVHA